MVTVMPVSKSSNYKAVPVFLRHQTILKPCFLLGRGIVNFSPALCLAGCRFGDVSVMFKVPVLLVQYQPNSVVPSLLWSWTDSALKNTDVGR